MLLGVTTSGAVAPAQVARARRAAERWKLPWVPRGHKQPLEQLLPAQGALLVFGGDGVTLADAQGELRFSPQMGQVRLRRLCSQQGGADRLVAHGELRPGDSVLDCTLGFGADALVAAWAVGPGGRVVGLEKSLPLFALVQEGLEAFPYDERSCRIDVLHEDHSSYLERQSRGSFDVVLFDPMFAKARGCTPSFDALRRYACHGQLDAGLLEKARRVARRWVLVKGARYSRDLRKLGLLPLSASRSATVVWGRVAGARGDTVEEPR